MSSSPFDLLPTEIIQKIFLSCLPENNMTILPPENLKKDSIVQLLWDNVMLSPPNNAALQLASLWFRHARGLPITLKVQTEFFYDDRLIHDLCRLISSHRFKSLGGDLKDYWLMLHDKYYEESFASLESIYLAFPIPHVQERQSPTGDDYCQLPSLRYLHLNFRCLNHFSVTGKRDLHMIPWHLLSTLIVHNATNFSTIFEMMRECKALVECRLLKFHVDPANVQAQVVSLATSLPHLRHLELFGGRPLLPLIKVLSAFNVPCITSIHLTHFRDRWSESPPDRFLTTDWLSRQLDAPFRQLQELTFSNVTNDYLIPSDVTKMLDVGIFLRRTPSLRRLALVGRVLLDHRTADEISTGKLGPHMDTISLRCCSSMERVLDMIEKRQENAKSNKEQSLQPFIHVRLATNTRGFSRSRYKKSKERAGRLERQYNVRIEMEPSLR